MNWPWSELGLPGPSELAAVRKAYAERLKTTHPEEDPEGFQRLHEAYQEARRLARQKSAASVPASKAPEEPETSASETGAPRENAQEEEPDGGQERWNYDRIFQEEARRRAEARERQASERREAFFAKYRPATEEEARQLERRFARIEAALTMIEELSDSHAILQEWIGFLHSGVFFSVKGDEDFVSALEAFLRRTPDLEETAKHEMAQAFGLRKREVPPVWRGLQELLTGEAYVPPPPTPPAVKKPLHQRWSVRIAVILLLLLAGIPLLSHQIKEMRERPGREARARMCQYLEEDLGRRMESRWNGQTAYENLYSAWDQPGLTFMAWPDGERDMAAGKPGYTTNYGNVMVTEALEAFAEQQRWQLEQDKEGGCSGVMGAYGTSPGGYRLEVPLWGAEEGLAALIALMESLQAERWYQAAPPYYELLLVYENITWFTYDSDRAFDGEALMKFYQTELGVDLCAYFTEQSGLAAADFGGEAYRLVGQGTVELDGQSYFLVSGVAEDTEETVRQYLFGGSRLVSLPAERFSLELKSYQISGDLFQSDWDSKPLMLLILRK